jgi:hypothetical protein
MMEISAMQAGTTPKKRTSLNGRAALKLMRLDGARVLTKRQMTRT